MGDINRCVLGGRLTRDAELKRTATGYAVLEFGIAVNARRKVGDAWEDVPNFFDVRVYGSYGESLDRRLKRGMPVVCDCRAVFEQWERDGERRSAVRFACDRLMFVGREGEAAERPRPAQGAQDAYADEDIPFG